METSRETPVSGRAGFGVGPSIAIVAFVAAAVSVGSLGHSFTYDDRAIIVENERIQDPGRILDWLTTNYWGESWNAGLYRPVTLATYGIQHAVHGLAPFGYHLVNVLLHTATSVLVLLVARRSFVRSGFALAAAAFFAAHPVHVEAVAGVVGRAELLAACGVLGASLLASPKEGEGLSPGRTVAALVVLALGLGSKEIAVVFVGWYLALRVLERRLDRGALGFAALATVGTVGFIAAKLTVTGTLGVPPSSIPFVNNPLASAEPFDRVATSLGLLARGVGLMVWPATLRHDYSFEQIPVAGGFGDPAVLLGAAILLGALAVAGRFLGRSLGRFRSLPASDGSTGIAVGLGACWFLLAWLPTSNLLAPIGTIFAERLLYLPSVGFALWAFGAIERHWRLPASPSIGLAILVVGALGVRSIERIPVWKDDRTLYEDGIRTSPRSARTHLELGKLLYNDSLAASGAEKRAIEDRALAELEAGMAIASDADPVASVARALLLESRYRSEEALEEFRRSATIEPNGPARLGELRVLGGLGRRSEMIEVAERLLESKPGEPLASDSAFLDAVADTLAAFGAREVSDTVRARAARVERSRLEEGRP